MPFRVLFSACKLLKVQDLYYCFSSMKISLDKIIWSYWCKMEAPFLNPCPPCSHTPCTHKSLNRRQRPTKVIIRVWMCWTSEQILKPVNFSRLGRVDEKVEFYCCYSTATKTNLYYSKNKFIGYKHESKCWNPKYSCTTNWHHSDKGQFLFAQWNCIIYLKRISSDYSDYIMWLPKWHLFGLNPSYPII